MPSKRKLILHWGICTVISFIGIYLFVFLGGWRLFQSGDPIMMEIAAALVIGFLIWIIFEGHRYHESKIAQLEKRVTELEKKLKSEHSL